MTDKKGGSREIRKRKRERKEGAGRERKREGEIHGSLNS